jgi:hypothetical protein
VFKNPREVISNISAVTDHLRAALRRNHEDTARRVLELIPTPLL